MIANTTYPTPTGRARLSSVVVPVLGAALFTIALFGGLGSMGAQLIVAAGLAGSLTVILVGAPKLACLAITKPAGWFAGWSGEWAFPIGTGLVLMGLFAVTSLLGVGAWRLS